jgi:hypothetical protein
MDHAERRSALGPALFAGLTIYTIVAQAFVPEDVNPADTMDMDAAARTAEAVPPGPVLWTAAHLAALRTTGLRAPRALAAPTDPDRLLAARPEGQARRVRVALTHDDLTSPVAAAAPPVAPSDLMPVSRTQITGPHRPASPDRSTGLIAPPQIVFVTGDRVRLRRAPGLDAPVLTTLDSGMRATATEQRDGWTRLQVNDPRPHIIGWMSSAYLRPARGVSEQR